MSTDRLVIFDFDGSITQGIADDRFEHAYRAHVADYLKRTLDEPTWARVFARIDAEPGQHGWRIEGRIVAGPADIFLRMMSASELILREHAPSLTDQELVDILNQAHLASVPAAAHVPRSGLDDLLSTVSAEEGRIVTNSSTVAVSRRAAELGIGWKVIGEAKKYRVDHTIFEPGERYGLQRPLYPVRPLYEDIIRRELGPKSPNVLTVIGDNLELDLLAPDRLGSRVILLVSERTQPWELAWIRSQPERRAVAKSLAAAAELLEGWRP